MTFQQIKKTRELLKRVDEVSSFQRMEFYLNELKGYYGTDLSLDLGIRVNNTKDSYTRACLEGDKAQIKAFLESQLAEDDVHMMVFDILDLMEEGEKCDHDKKSIQGFVAKAYYMYSEEIQFDEVTKALATMPEDCCMIQLPVNKNLLSGVLNKLKSYAIMLCSKKKTEEARGPIVAINNNNSASANSSVSVDLSLLIKQADKKAIEEGLSDAQLKEIKSKLTEIEEIAKNENSKGARWQKAKEILKWIAEQGIAVAGIILPLLAPMIG